MGVEKYQRENVCFHLKGELTVNGTFMFLIGCGVLLKKSASQCSITNSMFLGVKCV